MKSRRFGFGVMVVLVLLSGGLALASQDLILPWDAIEAKFVSAGIDDTGSITVAAKVDGDKWLSVEIEAYGKKFKLGDKQLTTLAGFPLNSLRVTYGIYSLEAPNGEHAVNIQVSKSTQLEKAVTTTTVSMRVSKGHGLEMSGPNKEMAVSN